MLFIYLGDCNKWQLGPALGTATSTAAATNGKVETDGPLDTAGCWVAALRQAERAFHSNSSAVFKLNYRNRKTQTTQTGVSTKNIRMSPAGGGIFYVFETNGILIVSIFCCRLLWFVFASKA